ncbi:MAG: Bax inhibitor-1/YccA family protein [bacterium]
MNQDNHSFNDGSARTGIGVSYNEGLRQYMLGVYNYMALGIGATAVFAMFLVGNAELTNILRGMVWLPFIGLIAIGFIGPRLVFTGSEIVAHSVYWVYVALWSMLIGPVVSLYAGAGLATDVYRAFFITATVFGAMSLYGYTTKKDLSGWGRFLFMATIGLLVAIVLNFLIFKSGLMGFVISSLVVLVFSAITAYETQMIKQLYADGADESNKRASILGAFMLYGSFATLFIHILNILGFMRD